MSEMDQSIKLIIVCIFIISCVLPLISLFKNICIKLNFHTCVPPPHRWYCVILINFLCGFGWVHRFDVRCCCVRGFWRQILVTPLLPAYFAPSHFGTDAFFQKKFLFQNTHFFHHIFSFYTFQNFLIFSQKTSQIKYRHLFKKKKENHLISIVQKICQNLPEFKVFFQGNPSISSKNPNFARFEKFHYFSRTLQQICYNLV